MSDLMVLGFKRLIKLGFHHTKKKERKREKEYVTGCVGLRELL